MKDLTDKSFKGLRRISLYDTEQVRTIIEKISNNIAAKYIDREPIALIGILRRGVPLANLINTSLEKLIYAPKHILRINLDVKRYADDLSLIHSDTLLTLDPLIETMNLEAYHLIIVDDVFYSGHSAFKVIQFLKTKNPKSISLACLVDRVCNMLPIRPDFIGVSLQVSNQSIIECNIPPYEPTLKIDITFV